VREIAGRSFARRETVDRITRMERELKEHERRIVEKLRGASCVALDIDSARALERLASARTRLHESAPHTRSEALMRWLDKEVVPGRVVSIGRGGRKLVLVTERTGGSLAGMREDGRRVTLALERVGRVYEEIYKRAKARGEEAFADVRAGRNEPLHEPRLREARAETDDAVAILNDLIEALTARDGDEAERARCEEVLWTTLEDAEQVVRVERGIEELRDESWRPFERRALVLERFGYLDFAAERVTERGRWLADLRLDRPLLVGEAIERGLFARLDPPRMAGVMAAMASDPDRDFGELALDDALLTALAHFEQVAYEVASEEWRQQLEPAPEINFSAAAATARWAAGADWPTLVRETRAEEGDLFRMLSRTGESLLQIGNLEEAHPVAAQTAQLAAAAILREPVRSDDV
jgi:hypothetical protein